MAKRKNRRARRRRRRVNRMAQQNESDHISDSGQTTVNSYYMLVKRGLVQCIKVTMYGRSAVVWPLTKTHKDAQRLCEYLRNSEARPARIGSRPGETMERHIATAIEQGCVAAWCVLGWENDGSPKWGWIPFY